HRRLRGIVADPPQRPAAGNHVPFVALSTGPPRAPKSIQHRPLKVDVIRPLPVFQIAAALLTDELHQLAQQDVAASPAIGAKGPIPDPLHILRSYVGRE